MRSPERKPPGGTIICCHSTLYARWLQRQVAGDPSLTMAERRELDLHLMLCLACNHEYARLLLGRRPSTAQRLLQSIESALTAPLVRPYLPDLIQAQQAGQELSDLQKMLWRFVQRDPQALGEYRLCEALAWLNDDLASAER